LQSEKNEVKGRKGVKALCLSGFEVHTPGCKGVKGCGKKALQPLPRPLPK